MMYFISGFQVFFRACFPSPSNCSIGEPKRAGVTFCFHGVLLKPYTVPHTHGFFRLFEQTFIFFNQLEELK